VTSSEVKHIKNRLTPEAGTHRLSQTLVTNYHCTLQNIPGERRSHSHRGKSLQSCAVFLPVMYCKSVQIPYYVFSNMF